MKKKLFHREIMRELKEKLWDTREMKQYTDIDTDLGGKITATTREKIFISFLKIFSLLNKNKTDFKEELTLVIRRIKLHRHQMTKLGEINVSKNDAYFGIVIKIIFIDLHKLKNNN